MKRTSVVLAIAFAMTIAPQYAGAQALEVTNECNGTPLDFRWEGHGSIQAEEQDGGIRFRTFGTGTLVAVNANFEILPNYIRVTTSSEQNIAATFLWQVSIGGARSQILRHALSIHAGNNVDTYIPLSRFSNIWQQDIVQIGILFPESTDVIVHEIAFGCTDIFSAIKNVIPSFWKINAMRTYSINFVWGPQFALNAAEYARMWNILPPPTTSATYVANLIIVFALLALFIVVWRKQEYAQEEKKMAFTVYGFLLFSAMWILFDIRMGAQYLSWVIHDYQTYSGQSQEIRTFRDRERFYDFAKTVATTVNDRERYIFYAQHDWPFLGNVRYITYPMLPTGLPSEDDTWVIYDRPDVTVNENGALEYEGQQLSNPGEVLLQFDETSFIFRETQ